MKYKYRIKLYDKERIPLDVEAPTKAFYDCYFNAIIDSLNQAYNIDHKFLKVAVNKTKTNADKKSLFLDIKCTIKGRTLSFDKTKRAIDNVIGPDGKVDKVGTDPESNRGFTKNPVQSGELKLQTVKVTPAKAFIESIFENKEQDNIKKILNTPLNKLSKKQLANLLNEIKNLNKEEIGKHKEEISSLYKDIEERLDSFEDSIQDNFCTLIPGLPKLKRGDKRFNQNSKYAKLKDSDTFDIMIEDLSTGEHKLLNNRTYSMLERLERNKNIRIIYTTPSDNEDLMDSKFRDVYPKRNESKGDFISRFMRETKEEYPDYKQRLAVAYSYWDRSKK